MERPLTKWFLKIRRQIVGDLIKMRPAGLWTQRPVKLLKILHSIPNKSAVQSVYIRTVKNDLPKVMENLILRKLLKIK